MDKVIDNIKSEYEEFAKNSIITVSKENDGYRITEKLQNGDAGVMLYFENNVLEAFNFGWKLEQNNPEYLGNACDKLIEILNEYEVKISVDGYMIKYKSKSHQ